MNYQPEDVRRQTNVNLPVVCTYRSSVVAFSTFSALVWVFGNIYFTSLIITGEGVWFFICLCCSFIIFVSFSGNLNMKNISATCGAVPSFITTDLKWHPITLSKDFCCQIITVDETFIYYYIHAWQKTTSQTKGCHWKVCIKIAKTFHQPA